MISGEDYVKAVRTFFSFLDTDFGFIKTKETINGNAFYDVEFEATGKVISVSYENIADHLEVIVYLLENKAMPHYDDRSKALHLKQLNNSILTDISQDEFESNAVYFADHKTESKIDKMLLKEAKELRLCLKHFKG
jgi:hypothetical protein